jgi:hypothetical protein
MPNTQNLTAEENAKILSGMANIPPMQGTYTELLNSLLDEAQFFMMGHALFTGLGDIADPDGTRLSLVESIIKVLTLDLKTLKIFEAEGEVSDMARRLLTLGRSIRDELARLGEFPSYADALAEEELED